MQFSRIKIFLKRFCDYQIIPSFFQVLSFYFRFEVALLDRRLYTFHPVRSGWTHIVLNYIGPNDDEGIRIYYNAEELESDITNLVVSFSAGDGRIVIGRGYTNENSNYASVNVDELLFFNRSLTPSEVTVLHNHVD